MKWFKIPDFPVQFRHILLEWFKPNANSNMLARLLLIFILVPLADLFLLLALAEYITIAATIALVVVSGIIGAWLAKNQIGKVGIRIRNLLSQNQIPADLLTDGGMILFAAGLLITPGLLTDLLGFSLLIPMCRTWYKSWAVKWIKKNFTIKVYGNHPQDAPDIVEGEVLSKKETKPGSLGNGN